LRHSTVVRAVSASFLLVGAGISFASSLGPIATRTGAPAFGGRPAESNCTNLCHNQIPTVNDPSGSLRILGVPAHYLPGQVYPITVQLQHTRATPSSNPLRWGFQMQACKASNGDSAGTWLLGANVPPDTFTFKISTSTGAWKRRQYVEHTRRIDNNQPEMGSNRYGQASPVTWTIDWKAPLTDVGIIYFFAAGNAANGDFTNGSGLAYSDTGDYIFTTAESTLAPLPVDVPPAIAGQVDFLGEPFPNPARNSTSLSFTVVRPGLLDIAVFDLNGRIVKTLLHGVRDAGPGTVTWDGASAAGEKTPNGVYFIRMFAPGEKRTLVRKVTLTR
jgi:hypothetical protein